MKKLSIIVISLLMISLNSCDCGSTATGENPLLSEWTTPFGVPPFEQIKTEHYMPAFEVAMEQQDQEIDAIANSTDAPTFENTIVALDGTGKLMTKVSRVFFALTSAETNPEMQKIQAEVSPILSQQGDKVLLNEKLFQRIKSVYDQKETLKLTPIQQRLLSKTYDRFARNGAALNAENKERLKVVNEELSVLSVKFGNNLLAENKKFTLEIEAVEDLAGLPQSVIDAAAQAAKDAGSEKSYMFTLNIPSIIPFITYSDNRELRKKLYNGYLDRCNYDNDTDNKQVVNDIVRLRTERANILGYDSHSAFTLDNVMAKTPENVYSLLNTLWEPALNRSKEELADMKKIMKQETGNDDFQVWDWWYYAEKVRKAKYDLDEEMVRSYLSLENVRAGIFELSNLLFGVTFKPVSIPIYHKDCQTYEVSDVDGSYLGVLYMDFHPRAGKRGGAWCTSFRSQTVENGERIAPIVSVVCNFTSPTGDNPALLSIDETTTFFHEFGHALHVLFSDFEYSTLGRVERDFVELPSQILENWAFEPEMLEKYAKHYKTGEVMPANLVEKISNSSKFNQGFITLEYIAASLTDLDIHTTSDYKPFDLNVFEKDILYDKRGMIEEIAPRYRYPYFSHIFSGGYSSGYYSYIWAGVLDKDAYNAFVESGDLFNKDVAARFRTLLASGGTADGMDLYRAFRGAEPSKEALLKARGLQ